jgi:hypothetical protein
MLLLNTQSRVPRFAAQLNLIIQTIGLLVWYIKDFLCICQECTFYVTGFSQDPNLDFSPGLQFLEYTGTTLVTVKSCIWLYLLK